MGEFVLLTNTMMMVKNFEFSVVFQFNNKLYTKCKIKCRIGLKVDSLKSLCEHSLKHHLDEDSCLFLLGLADQLHCKALRVS